jgi:hypothetical protein
MTENLSNVSWEEITADPRVIPVDHRYVLSLDTDELHATYLLELNRIARTLLVKKLVSPAGFHVQPPIHFYPYLLLNPDFEGLKTLVRTNYSPSRKSLELAVVKKADNARFDLLILQVNDLPA